MTADIQYDSAKNLHFMYLSALQVIIHTKSGAAPKSNRLVQHGAVLM